MTTLTYYVPRHCACEDCEYGDPIHVAKTCATPKPVAA